jgi:hypothetical protein
MIALPCPLRPDNSRFSNVKQAKVGEWARSSLKSTDLYVDEG